MSEADTDCEIPDEILQHCEGLSNDDLPLCSSHVGHSLTPVNDEKGGPQTRMVCVHCNASRPVQEGDLERYPDSWEYPPWCNAQSKTNPNGGDQ